MQTLKHAIKIFKGEQLYIDKEIVNADGTPFVIPKLSNPYFLVSFSDNRYSVENRFIRNYWLRIPNSFNYIDIMDSDNIVDFDSIDTLPRDVQFVGDNTMYELEKDDYVFKKGDEYIYWNDESSNWENYFCRIILTIPSTETVDWSVGNYQYSIQLVSGIDNREYLNNIAIGLGIINFSTLSTEDLYKQILQKGYTFPLNYKHDQPIGVVDYSVSILPPTNLEVINYTQGDITW